ncbi:unnamed protein product [Menidia menidia]|uniref:(Atlantic silverside) hypothetical protein n=1 Tax=Menidia menidia TaxID=238744 RepID=A0A8S4BEU2_9TELE|nr:unnamed protein product [Menidia menidia]
MDSQSEMDLSCPVCHDVFKDPVILLCSHSFCKDCLQRWWSENQIHKCPLCQSLCWIKHPPSNLALKNLCESFLLKSAQKAPAGPDLLCPLHNEKLKLFCLDHQQPLCVICRDSKAHNNHRFRPVDEAAKDHREELLKSLKPLKDKLAVLKKVKGNFEQTAKHIKEKAEMTKSKIKKQFQRFHQFLKEEEEAQIAAVSQEEEEKGKAARKKIETLSRQIAETSETIRATEEELRAADGKMSSLSEKDLSCTLCHEVFRDPVDLECGHSFCKDCLKEWWSAKPIHKCPLCKEISLLKEPGCNLELKKQCQTFLEGRGRKAPAGSEPLCADHAEKFKLFCLDHRQPLCVVCRDSKAHSGHRFRPVNEAAQDHREELLQSLKPLQDKLNLLVRVKRDFDEQAEHVELRAQRVSSEIKEMFDSLRQFLRDEEEARQSVLEKERKQKSCTIREKSKSLSRDIAALSEIIEATEEELRAADDAESPVKPLRVVAEPLPLSRRHAGQILGQAEHRMSRVGIQNDGRAGHQLHRLFPDVEAEISQMFGMVYQSPRGRRRVILQGELLDSLDSSFVALQEGDVRGSQLLLRERDRFRKTCHVPVQLLNLLPQHPLLLLFLLPQNSHPELLFLVQELAKRAAIRRVLHLQLKVLCCSVTVSFCLSKQPESVLERLQAPLQLLPAVLRGLVDGSESVAVVRFGVPTDETHGPLVVQTEEFEFLGVQAADGLRLVAIAPGFPRRFGSCSPLFSPCLASLSFSAIMATAAMNWSPWETPVGGLLLLPRRLTGVFPLRLFLST